MTRCCAVNGQLKHFLTRGCRDRQTSAAPSEIRLANLSNRPIMCRATQEPQCQKEALFRQKIIRKARSNKVRAILLVDLDERYRQTSDF
jgi:hypothetical protein